MEQESLRLKLKASLGLSNDLLSNREESLVRELLQEANNTVSSIDADILRIRSTLRSFEQQRAEELDWITRLKEGISPQKKVPPEILGHIFKSCVENALNVPPHRTSQCLVLSQVCSRWRHVALAESSLWNVLSIEYPRRVQPDALKAILSRAGQTITLSLTMEHIPPPVLRILTQYSAKFQTVELRYDLSREMEHLRVPFERLGALRTLRLDVIDDSDNPDPFPLYYAISAFANPSNLHLLSFELTAYGVDLDLGTSSLPPFPWWRLEHLKIHCYITPTKFLHILTQCTRLESCEANLESDEDDVALLPDTMRFTLTNLSTLDITSCESSLNKVIDSITTPSLEVFRIYFGPISSDTLLRFIQRSKCNIEIVSLVLVPTTPPSVVEQFFNAIPDVVGLTLLGSLNVVLSEAILDSIGTGSLLPNLERMKCWVSSCRAFRKLVSIRCDPSSDGSVETIEEFTACVSTEDVTDEWREFKASLPKNGVVRIYFSQRIRSHLR